MCLNKTALLSGIFFERKLWKQAAIITMRINVQISDFLPMENRQKVHTPLLYNNRLTKLTL